jgi:SAM-dependent methyltransferase
VTGIAEFDSFADSYDRDLGEALAASGENRSYFARGRVTWMADIVRRMGSKPQRLMDYGCGTGSTTTLLLEALGAEAAVGVDLSMRSLEVARKSYGSERLQFLPIAEYAPAGKVDLAYCNGVFHHIPPAKRSEALRFVHRSLCKGGLFSCWENNPWNPGTRHVMAHCAFDKDAVTLSPPEAKQLMRSEGFTILRTDFLFIFPRFLKLARPAEKFVSKLPLGAQYQILCEKQDR